MSDGKSEREQRLAAALRANLRRRKGQARELGQSGPDGAAASGPGQPDASAGDEAGESR